MDLNFDRVKSGATQAWDALAEGWDLTFEKFNAVYDQGAVDYQAFLDGSLNAFAEKEAAQDEIQAVIDEKRKAKISQMWLDHFTGTMEWRIKNYNAKKKALEEEEKLEAAAAKKELKLEDQKNQAKKKGYFTTVNAIGSMMGSFFGRTKGVAKAQALIDTYAGMNRALGTGVPPWSFITAALVAAQGFANVEAINAQRYALGGEINKPTLALAGEAGPEIVAPKKTFIDVANQMIRGGQIGGGGSSVQELRAVKDAIDNLELTVTFDAEEMAIIVESGNRDLELRTI